MEASPAPSISQRPEKVWKKKLIPRGSSLSNTARGHGAGLGSPGGAEIPEHCHGYGGTGAGGREEMGWGEEGEQRKEGSRRRAGREAAAAGGEGRSLCVPIWAMHHIEIVPH